MSHYEITIGTLNNGVLFKIQAVVRGELRDTCKLLKEKFPKSEGYHIIVTQWIEEGHQLDLDDVINYESPQERLMKRNNRFNSTPVKTVPVKGK